MPEFNSSNIRIWSRLGSCGAFGIAALELPEIDNNTVILTPDLSYYSGLTRFKEEYPNNFYNLGIAEQNIIGVAAAMAKEKLNPFVTTYASFISRCLDQIKVNMGYMQLPIKLIGLTAGLAVGILGATHVSIEDIAILRAIPNITILSPCDCSETIKCILAAQKLKKPCYIRLTGSFNNPIVHKQDYDYEIGKSEVLQDGEDIAILATGSMVANSIKAVQIINDELTVGGGRKPNIKIINIHTIKPIDIEAIKNCTKAKLIVTVEEHSIIGGLGSTVAECLCKIRNKPPQLFIGIEDIYKKAGTYEYLLEEYGLSPQAIAKKIIYEYKNL